MVADVGSVALGPSLRRAGTITVSSNGVRALWRVQLANGPWSLSRWKNTEVVGTHDVRCSCSICQGSELKSQVCRTWITDEPRDMHPISMVICIKQREDGLGAAGLYVYRGACDIEPSSLYVSTDPPDSSCR